jgi:proline-rich protein PRCC
VPNTGAPEKAETAAEDSEDSGREEAMPVPDQQEDGGRPGPDAGASQHRHQGYDAGAGSSSGYEAYALCSNYHAQCGASSGWDPSGNADYATGEQYAAYGGEQGGGCAHPQGGERVGGYANVVAVSYGADYAGGYGHEAAAAATFPPVNSPRQWVGLEGREVLGVTCRLRL